MNWKKCSIAFLLLAIAWIVFSALNKEFQPREAENGPDLALSLPRKRSRDSAGDGDKYVDLDISSAFVRERIQNSESAKKDILRAISEINKLRGIKREVAIGTFLSALADFENPREATSWVGGNRDLLFATLSTLDVGQGRSGYDDLLFRVESQCRSNGVDFISAVKHLGNEHLEKDVLPLKFAINGEWNEADLASVDAATRKKIEAGTIRQLALTYFANRGALRMMLDSRCSIGPNQELTEQVMNREYFWKNTLEMMEIIESAQPSPTRDLSLIRAVDLIAERDPDSALLWTNLIQDSQKREAIISNLKE